MLKNGILYILAIAMIFAGCQKKAGDVFDKSPDQRLSDALTAYQQALAGAPNGWKVMIFPKGLEKQDIKVGGFYYYMKFTNDNRVTMVSDFDSTTASTPKESGYRLKAVQRPSLYFDTYSYIHIPSDPTSAISRSPSSNEGLGWGSDFEFSFTEPTPSGDTIRLKGNFNGSEAMMVKATAQEAAAFNNKQLATSLKLLQNLGLIGYFKVLTLGGAQYFINIDESNRLITFSWLSGGNVQTFTTGYYSSITGIGLASPFNTGSQIIQGIDFTSWNAAITTMNVTAGGTAGTISDAGRPLKVDASAPSRWWQQSSSQGDFWFSVNGFTVNGVRDAYNIRGIQNFYFLIYWAGYGANYDLLGFVKINDAGTALTLPYGSGHGSPIFTPDGRAVFPLLGTLGTVPAEDQAAFQNTVNKMADPNGYYFIQTSASTYDMVSKDGKTWLTWQF
jgi:hypothetical protein